MSLEPGQNIWVRVVGEWCPMLVLGASDMEGYWMVRTVHGTEAHWNPEKWSWRTEEQHVAHLLTE